MPLISESTLTKYKETVSGLRKKAAGAGRRAMERTQANQVKATAEMLAGAGSVGFLRGKMEDGAGKWVLPGTDIDVEAVIGLVGIGAGLGGRKYLGAYADDVINFSSGVLAHYTGQITRKYAKTGVKSFIAGSDPYYGEGGQPGGYTPISGDEFNEVGFNGVSGLQAALSSSIA